MNVQTFAGSTHHFLRDLSCSDDDVRLRTAVELRKFVESDLKELPQQSYSKFIEDLCEKLRGLLLLDTNSRIVCLAETDFMAVHSHCAECVELIKTTGLASDLKLTFSQARLIGHLGLFFPSDYVYDQMAWCMNTLNSDTASKSARLLAVLVFQEFALITPTSFFQVITNFKNSILRAFQARDAIIHEFAALALRAGLAVMAEREAVPGVSAYSPYRQESVLSTESKLRSPQTALSSQSSVSFGSKFYQSNRESQHEIAWYMDCLREALSPFIDSFASEKSWRWLPKMGRSDSGLGSLLLFGELLLAINADYLALYKKLNVIAEQPLEFTLSVNLSKGAQALRANYDTKWPSMSTSALDPMYELCLSSSATKFDFSPPGLSSRVNSRIEPVHNGILAVILREELNHLWAVVLQNLDSKDPRHTQQLFFILPALVALQKPERLDDERLCRVLNWLLQCMNKDRERPTAILCMAFIAHTVGFLFCQSVFWEKLKPIIISGLPSAKDNAPKKGNASLVETAVLMSLGLLVESQGHGVHEFMRELLGHLMACGLSRPLIYTYRLLARHVPTLKSDVQICLVKLLDRALPDQAPPLGSPSPQTVALALHTLATFDFEDCNLAYFVRRMADHFVCVSQCEIKELRIQAVGACARLMKPWLLSCETPQAATKTIFRTIGNILVRLLAAGTSDPEPEVRKHVFLSLDADFDLQLAQNTHLSYLYSALQDENFEIRCLVMRTLGRLSERNPACVEPNFRKVFDQIISLLDNGGLPRTREQAALLLATLLASAPRFFIQYANKLVLILLPKIKAALPPTLRAQLMTDSIKLMAKIESSDRHQVGTTNMLNLAFLSSHMALQAARETSDAIGTASSRLGTGSGMAAHGNIQPLSKVQTQLLRDATQTAKSAASNAVNAALAVNSTISAGTLDSAAPRCIDHGWLVQAVHSIEAQDKNLQSMLLNVRRLDRSDEMDQGKRYLLPWLGRGAPCLSDLKGGMFANSVRNEGQDSEMNASGQPWSEPTRVIVSFFITVGHLCNVAPEAIRPHANDLILLLSHMMSDSSCFHKRFIAVWTLGMLVMSLGMAVVPYELEPGLLNTLINLLRKEECRMMRREVIKVLGLIGALDPFKFKIYSGQVDCVGDTGIAVSLHEQDNKEVEFDHCKLMNTINQETRDEFFAMCALSTLVKALRQPQLRSQFKRVARTITFVLQSLGPRASNYLRLVMPDYLLCLRETRDRQLQEMMLIDLASLVAAVDIYIKEFANEITDLLLSLWWIGDLDVQLACIRLLSPLNKALVAEFQPCLTKLLPTIVRTLNYEQDNRCLVEILEVLPEFLYNVETFMHILVPPILNLADLGRLATESQAALMQTSSALVPQALEDPSAIEFGVEAISMKANSGSLQLCEEAFNCLLRLSAFVDLCDMAGRIVHTTCRLLLSLYNRQQHCEQQARTAHSKSMHSDLIRLAQNAKTFLSAIEAKAVDLFTNLFQDLGDKSKLYQPIIEYTLKHIKTDKTWFQSILCGHSKGAAAPSVPRPSGSSQGAAEEESTQRPNSDVLQRAWQFPQTVNRDDWTRWLRTLTSAFINQSPNRAIQACHSLTNAAPGLAMELFNAAFVTCWSRLTDQQQDDLIASFEKVLRAQNQPAEVSEVILNLEEFMDHYAKNVENTSDITLPLSFTLLADRAMKNRSYAKALYYKEQLLIEQSKEPSVALTSPLVDLIFINDKLELRPAARGVLIYATKMYKEKLVGVDLETWYEKLQDWDRALSMYERKLEDERIREKSGLVLGRMRCLHALGQWSQLNTVAYEWWDRANDETRANMAPLAMISSLAVENWRRFDFFSQAVTKNSFDGSFFAAVHAVHRNDLDQAMQLITKTRDILDAELGAMSSESYNRAYPDLIRAQLLSELEEIVHYQRTPEARPMLRKAWLTRLQAMHADVQHWNTFLLLRSLVLKPHEQLTTWIKFAGLCRRNNRLLLCKQILENLMGKPVNPELETADFEPIVTPEPTVVFAYTKWLWSSGKRGLAIDRLFTLKTRVLEPVLTSLTAALTDPRVQNGQLTAAAQLEQTAAHPAVAEVLGNYLHSPSLHPHLEENRLLMAKCCLRLGRWYSESELETVKSSAASEDCERVWETGQEFVIQCFRTATELAPGKQAAWQAWAMANYASITHLEQLRSRTHTSELETRAVRPTRVSDAGLNASGPSQLTQQNSVALELMRERNNLREAMERRAVPAVRGFINSISLSPRSNLQDSLRLIHLLFKFGHLAPVRDLIQAGLLEIPLENWIMVIQQLLARIDTAKEYISDIVIKLLIDIGKKHPQSMVNPLVLSFKSGGSDRRRYNANRILYSMEEHSSTLVYEAFLLNEELIRLSITWVEMWSECLDDACRSFYCEEDVGKMFRLLHPLHLVMSRGHETIDEATFLERFKDKLDECCSHCQRYEETGAQVDIQQAWNGYKTLYRDFSRRIAGMNCLELTVSAPRLVNYGTDWQLSVPGAYEPNKSLVRMSGIKNCLTFINSKQRPRKMCVLGSNGRNYFFLLKGHEDTRLDDRVMQFFGLVNTLLVENPETLRMNLTIQRLSIIPLSTNTGLIGWVPNSDTLHSLVRMYRDKNRIQMNMEHREMLQLAPTFDHLNIMQKTEVFEATLRESSGRDLAEILWLRSANSQAWFESRTNFIRSLATMSVVGYILGLGDRHPSNLMLCRETGKVIHIDFGDCFDVAMMREKFPEKVPFRLTRMFVRAMEVTGIDGVFRHTCETVMSLMRENRESLLAVLEAFIHDPLLQWVLLDNRKDPTRLQGRHTGQQAGDQSAAQPVVNQNVQRVPAANEAIAAAPSAARRAIPSSGARPRGLIGVRPGNLRIFGDPNYPYSASLRDPLKANHLRHHLCNGPWFGSYEKAKKRRIILESGVIVVERDGLDGFIFSAKPLNSDQTHSATEKTYDANAIVAGNTRARDVMDQIHRKLTGSEKSIIIVKPAQPSGPQALETHSTIVYTYAPTQNHSGTNGSSVPPAPYPTNLQSLDVKSQVDWLIHEASSNQNLCQMYIGWCPFW